MDDNHGSEDKKFQCDNNHNAQSQGIALRTVTSEAIHQQLKTM